MDDRRAITGTQHYTCRATLRAGRSSLRHSLVAPSPHSHETRNPHPHTRHSLKHHAGSNSNPSPSHCAPGRVCHALLRKHHRAAATIHRRSRVTEGRWQVVWRAHHHARPGVQGQDRCMPVPRFGGQQAGTGETTTARVDVRVPAHQCEVLTANLCVNAPPCQSGPHSDRLSASPMRVGTCASSPSASPRATACG